MSRLVSIAFALLLAAGGAYSFSPCILNFNRQWSVPLFAKGFGGGGGAKADSSTKEKPWKVVRDTRLDQEVATMDPERRFDIRSYMNPIDDATMAEIKAKLHAGDLVVIKNAFLPSFAEVVHREISSSSTPWTLNEAYFDNGYAYKHSNIYEMNKWTKTMNDTFTVFTSDATKNFIADLSGRDCSGVTTGSPSRYGSGDHSLPHTDWYGQRTVSYVWHLSKDWKPEWGGALYWAQHPHDKATYAASFNTLVLFGVTTTSAHFVTTVSPHSVSSQRLAFNGWWQSSWIPRSDDFEEKLSSSEKRAGVTHFQLQALTDMQGDKWTKLSTTKQERLADLRGKIMSEFYPSKLSKQLQ